MHILFLVVCLRFSWGGGVIFKNMLAGVSKKKNTILQDFLCMRLSDLNKEKSSHK